MPVTELPPSVIGRFWPKVDRRGPDECWPWTASLGGHGYGQLSVGDTMVTAHRVAHYIEHGHFPPEGMHIDHLCRNRACVNPAHLEVVTHAENLRRGLPAKLTAEQVAEVRVSGLSNRQLAHQLGVHHSTVGRIRTGKGWR